MYCHVQQEGLCTLCHVEDMFLHEAPTHVEGLNMYLHLTKYLSSK
jgi:hypothetical protein